MPSPLAAHLSGHELGRWPRNYGHLLGLASRYARASLDRHTVVNRETGWPIELRWLRGLKQALAPGVPPALLLAVPALPAMLASGRYLGDAADPLRRQHIRRLHGFAAAISVAGQPQAAVLSVREDGLGRLRFDRILPDRWYAAAASEPSPSKSGSRTANRQDGGATTDGNAPILAPPDTAADVSDDTAAATGAGTGAQQASLLAAFWGAQGSGVSRDADQGFDTADSAQQIYGAPNGRRPLLTQVSEEPEEEEEEERERNEKPVQIAPGPPVPAVGRRSRFEPQPFGIPGLPKSKGTTPLEQVPEGSAGRNATGISSARGATDDPGGTRTTRQPGPSPATASEGSADASGAPRASESIARPNTPLGDAPSPVEPPEPGGPDDQSSQGSPYAPAPRISAPDPSARAYTVIYSVQLPPELRRGTRRAHYREANEALLKEMEENPEFAEAMRLQGVTLERTPTGLAPAKPPQGWSWHHSLTPGEMHLVPYDEHRPGSPLFGIYHPGWSGGYLLWGKPLPY